MNEILNPALDFLEQIAQLDPGEEKPIRMHAADINQGAIKPDYLEGAKQRLPYKINLKEYEIKRPAVNVYVDTIVYVWVTRAA